MSLALIPISNAAATSLRGFSHNRHCIAGLVHRQREVIRSRLDVLEEMDESAPLAAEAHDERFEVERYRYHVADLQPSAAAAMAIRSASVQEEVSWLTFDGDVVPMLLPRPQ